MRTQRRRAALVGISAAAFAGLLSGCGLPGAGALGLEDWQRDLLFTVIDLGGA